MKKLIALFLMLLILSQLVVRLGVYVSWKMNQEYLSKTECVNRNVKGSCCNAKCQLEKRMSKVDNSDQPNDSKKSSTQKFAEIEPFILITESISCVAYRNEILLCPTYKSVDENHSLKHLQEVFHPPNHCLA